MGRTSAVRKCLQQATRALCSAAAGSAAANPATTADADALEAARRALHGHG